MSIDVHVSAMLRHLCGGRSSFAAEGKSIREVAEAISHDYPGFAELVLQPDGSIQKGMLVSLNGEMIQPISGGEIAVKSGDKILILSAVAGG
jgi:molybdopterin converting factor small subunit